MSFKSVIQRRRMEMNKSINYVAMKAGVNWVTWKSWEDGKSMPSMKVLYRVAEALNCTRANLVS